MIDLLNPQPIVEKFFRIALILLGAYLTKRVLIKVLHKVLNDYISKLDHTLSKKIKKERIKTLGSVLSNLVSVAIGIVTALLVLSELDINIAPLIAGIGVLGLGVGFASQTLVRDYISGFFILFENQFNIGDQIEVGGKKGRVEELSLRTTILKDGEGNVHVIPNSKITTVTRFRTK